MFDYNYIIASYSQGRELGETKEKINFHYIFQTEHVLVECRISNPSYLSFPKISKILT